MVAFAIPVIIKVSRKTATRDLLDFVEKFKIMVLEGVGTGSIYKSIEP